MTDAAPERHKSRNTLSNLFAAVAVILAILAVVLYLRPGRGIAPVPTAAPGGNQLINVVRALETEGLEVRQPQGLFVPAEDGGVPGQGLEIAGDPAFVFLYPDESQAQDAVLTLDPAAVVPGELRGTPMPAGEHRITQGSNVVLIMAGGDDATWQKVEAAVAGLA
ncbi:MAG: hypothetical protein KC432_01995 [Thermomicrobiales bacterium]|nr:hypothetical protein [Thermomicrobiales bacterium]